MTQEEAEKGRKYHLYMRVVNVILTALICAAAIIKLLASPDLALGVICLYAFGFSVLICCFETHFKQVALLIQDNFGFMYDATGRFFFMIFVGILCWSLGIIGYIAGALMIVNACVGFYIMYKYPHVFTEELESFEETMGKHAAQAAANNPEAVAAGAGAAAGWAANNPDQARSAAGAAGYDV
mmetsp:Transcript_30301/g.96654  ORF Transcript_30301/g.96654 Transcript_30301/m.96654 type:complete len:183 (+) Transcript_30301:573-1121(+)